MKHKATVIFHDSYDMIKFLTVKEKGLLFEAIIDYDVKGIEPELPSRFLEYAFMSFKKQLDANREHYEEVCRARGKSARKRWEKEEEAGENEPSEADEMQKEANAMQNNANEENTKTNTKTKSNKKTNTKKKTSSKTNVCVISEGDAEEKPFEADAADLSADTHTEKNTYGEFSNVFLTDEEHKRINERFSDGEKRIDSLSAYLKTSGRFYPDHYAMLINWKLYDTSFASHQVPEVMKKPPGERREPTFDVSEFTKKAIGIKYVKPDE